MHQPVPIASRAGFCRWARRRAGGWLSVAGWLAAASCAADRDGSSSALALERYCETVCESRTKCGLEQQPNSGCFALCEQDPNARGRHAAFWSAQVACLENQSCVAWLDESARNTCLATTLRGLTPSARCIEYCATDAVRSFECGAGYSVEECVRGLTCSFREDVLVALASCNAEPDCVTRASCLATKLSTP